MKATVFLALAITGVKAIQLAPNTLCGDSGSCAQNCGEGRFHIVQDDSGIVFFGCSQKPNEYDQFTCNLGAVANQLDGSKFREICDTIGGRFCPRNFRSGLINYCIAYQIDEPAFYQSCKDAGGSPGKAPQAYPYDIATSNCPNS